MSRVQKQCVLVTGGPTRAYLDDVRYISNISTGELAFQLCESLCDQGMDVILVVGPSACPFEKLHLRALYCVETSAEMRSTVLRVCRRDRPDYAVFSAAVLDFEPDKKIQGKTSSSRDLWIVKLKRAPKIIDEVARRFPKIRRIGFKLEWKPRSRISSDRLAWAVLKEKKLELLCLNFLSLIRKGKHPARLYRFDGRSTSAKSKREIARQITCYIREHC